MKRKRPIKVGSLSVRPHVRNGLRTGAWQVDVSATVAAGGRRERRSFKTRKDAEEYAARVARRMDVRAQASGAPTAVSGLSFAEAAEQWMEEQIAAVKAGLKRRSTLQTNVFQLKALLGFFGSLDLNQITRLKVMEYQSQRRERDGVSAPTINSETARLKQVLTWAQEQKLCLPMARFSALPVRQTPPDLPSLEEVMRVVEYLPPKVALLVKLLIETGCRPGEAYGLTWADVDFRRATIRFRPSIERGLKTPESERTVHVSSELASELKGCSRTSNFVFCGKHGGPVTSIRKALRAAVVKSGVVRRGEPIELTPKSFRKAHGTFQIMRGMPEPIVQARMGHTRGSRTLAKYYLWASEHADKEAIILLPKPVGPT